MTTTIPVVETFGPTISGEGSLLGVPTVFVRTGGCDYRCSWCDSLHAVLPEHRDKWEQLSPSEIFHRIREMTLAPYLVTISGGNPVMHPLQELLDLLRADGYSVNIETQGTIAKEWLALCEYVTISPKPPSADQRFDMSKLLRCIYAATGQSGYRSGVSIKIPIFDREDFDFAVGLKQSLKVEVGLARLPFYLSVGNPNPPADEGAESRSMIEYNRREPPSVGKLLRQYEKIATWALNDGHHDFIITPQMHVLLWGNKAKV